MEIKPPSIEDIQNLSIRTLGAAHIPSPLSQRTVQFVSDENKILVYTHSLDLKKIREQNMEPPEFELAGPRDKLFFDPANLTCGIVTCGGLCPGLNDVIRTITLGLYWQYGVKKVLGFRFGYEGLSSLAKKEPLLMTPDNVDQIQHAGGSILGTSRGPQNLEDMVDVLVKNDISILFVVGGDGTFKGAHQIAELINNRRLKISIISVPKTIDNDIFCSERTFGFYTAVEEARKSIVAAHNEAKAVWNGIGLVKLMGRDSGFIATHATLANSDVNFCFIPEEPLFLDGETGILSRLEKRLARRQHAVIVVAEGAGQNLMADNNPVLKDASGNIIFHDIGLYLKEKISGFFKQKNIPVTIKYIDPSYMIRSCPSIAPDSTFCIMLGQNAVHAGMAGKTDMFVGYWNDHFTHVPLTMAVGKRKKVDLTGEIWQTVKLMTE
ncbi:MAG: ATP-dependent 6-phosphofructokinase [Candidatus Omnitrophica bacterium]|nr:ATP-dependent 6-phosphofructokinase [Candidatus Omnitrophota bacterium]